MTQTQTAARTRNATINAAHEVRMAAHGAANIAARAAEDAADAFDAFDAYRALIAARIERNAAIDAANDVYKAAKVAAFAIAPCRCGSRHCRHCRLRG